MEWKIDVVSVVNVHVTFAIPSLHKDTLPLVLNQTGSAVKNKQPIAGDMHQRVSLNKIEDD